MDITIKSIAENAQCRYVGNVTVEGDIGKNASVIIKNGNLIVKGNIKDSTHIDFIEAPAKSSAVGSALSNILKGDNYKQLQVQGNIGNYVTVRAQKANFTVVGSIGKQCHLNTNNGNIITGHVGKNTTITSHHGSVMVDGKLQKKEARDKSTSILTMFFTDDSSMKAHGGSHAPSSRKAALDEETSTCSIS